MGFPHLDVLLFVGVAVLWAVYLIPKALHHHEQAERARTVDRFSHTLRVLARREPVSRRSATLVVPATARRGETAAPAEQPPSAAEVRARREASRRATKRRRRVLGVLLVSLAAVAGAAAYGVIEWWYVAIPASLLAGWLVACRVMVKGEARSWQRRMAPESAHAPVDAAEADPMSETTEIAMIGDSLREPGMWDPVPVTLPTYVSKPAATRSVRSIDLESEGVWTSGRTAADTALARQADAADAAARKSAAAGDDQRAAGAAG